MKTSSPEASFYRKGTHAMAMSSVAGQEKLKASITLLIHSFLKNPGILLAASPQTKKVFNDLRSLKSSSFTVNGNQTFYFIGKPIYKFRSNGKITVLVPYFNAEKELTLSNIEVFNHKLSTAIHLSLKKTQFDVNVDIRLIRVQYPYLDSAIFAQYIALNVGKYNLTQIKNMITRSYSPEA